MGLRSHLHLRKPKYEIVMWTVHLTVTALAIIDRFTTNVWPRLSFTIGAGSAGNDRMGGFKEGPWVSIYSELLICIGTHAYDVNSIAHIFIGSLLLPMTSWQGFQEGSL